MLFVKSWGTVWKWASGIQCGNFVVFPPQWWEWDYFWNCTVSSCLSAFQVCCGPGHFVTEHRGEGREEQPNMVTVMASWAQGDATHLGLAQLRSGLGCSWGSMYPLKPMAGAFRGPERNPIPWESHQEVFWDCPPIFIVDRIKQHS